MMKNKKISIFFIMICMTLLVACGNSEEKDIPFYSTDEKLYKIETENYELFYPEKWEDKISVDIDDKKDSCIVEFSTDINDENVKLFNFIFDEKGNYIIENDGYKVGKIISEENKTDVLIEVYTDKIDTFTQEEKNMIFEMTEDSNVIISKLIEDYNLELETTE